MLYKDIEIIKGHAFSMDIEFVTALNEPIDVKGNGSVGSISAVKLANGSLVTINSTPTFDITDTVSNILHFKLTSTDTNNFNTAGTATHDVYGHPEHTYAYAVYNTDDVPILRGKVAVVGKI